jgi:5-methylcytosine-specific restriction protein A
MNHPLCVKCGRAASLVDHILPHKGNQELFWNSDNWQSMCATCHNIKTASEDGGFGNSIKPTDDPLPNWLQKHIDNV